MASLLGWGRGAWLTGSVPNVGGHTGLVWQQHVGTSWQQTYHYGPL